MIVTKLRAMTDVEVMTAIHFNYDLKEAAAETAHK